MLKKLLDCFTHQEFGFFRKKMRPERLSGETFRDDFAAVFGKAQDAGRAAKGDFEVCGLRDKGHLICLGELGAIYG